MKELAAEALDEGAFGLSSGLIYPPGIFSREAEMIEVCRSVAAKGGFYATHIRNEADDLIPSVAEAIRVAEQAGIALEISHHKAAGRQNWGKCQTTLAMLEAFTVTPDHERQHQVWERISTSWQKEPWQIRNMLTETTVPAADKRALLHSHSDVSYDMSHRHFGIAADCIYTVHTGNFKLRSAKN